MIKKDKLLFVPESIVRGLIELLDKERCREAVALMSADLEGDMGYIRNMLWNAMPGDRQAQEDLDKLHRVYQWFLREMYKLQGDSLSKLPALELAEILGLSEREVSSMRMTLTEQGLMEKEGRKWRISRRGMDVVHLLNRTLDQKAPTIPAMTTTARHAWIPSARPAIAAKGA
jgi:hypothetical protein